MSIITTPSRQLKVEDNTAIITYTIAESSSKDDPFYLQNLMYDLPIDIDQIESLKLQITVPEGISCYIIDDLHFEVTKKNNVEIVLRQSSQVTYQLFVANHQLCDTCIKKESKSCQTIPPKFEKSLHISLEEPLAQAYVKCHYLGDQDSMFHITTTQHHLSSNTTSKLIVKGVLDDQAKLVSDNQIIVDKNLNKVVAEQINKNLMLSSDAHTISIPRLKIDSQDVSCKHGATIRALDKEEMFYLQSRGLSLPDSERILIKAFLGQSFLDKQELCARIRQLQSCSRYSRVTQ